MTLAMASCLAGSAAAVDASTVIAIGTRDWVVLAADSYGFYRVEPSRKPDDALFQLAPQREEKFVSLRFGNTPVAAILTGSPSFTALEPKTATFSTEYMADALKLAFGTHGRKSSVPPKTVCPITPMTSPGTDASIRQSLGSAVDRFLSELVLCWVDDTLRMPKSVSVSLWSRLVESNRVPAVVDLFFFDKGEPLRLHFELKPVMRATIVPLLASPKDPDVRPIAHGIWTFGNDRIIRRILYGEDQHLGDGEAATLARIDAELVERNGLVATSSEQKAASRLLAALRSHGSSCATRTIGSVPTGGHHDPSAPHGVADDCALWRNLWVDYLFEVTVPDDAGGLPIPLDKENAWCTGDRRELLDVEVAAQFAITLLDVQFEIERFPTGDRISRMLRYEFSRLQRRVTYPPSVFVLRPSDLNRIDRGFAIGPLCSK